MITKMVQGNGGVIEVGAAGLRNREKCPGDIFFAEQMSEANTPEWTSSARLRVRPTAYRKRARVRARARFLIRYSR